LASAVLVLLGSLTACKPPSTRTTVGIFLPYQSCCVGGGEIISEAQALGVRTVRFSQDVTQPVRGTFAVFERAGMRVVFSAINDPQPDGLGHNPGRPPGDLGLYRRQLGTVLDGMADPVVVQIENEEIARNFYVGTMAEYVEQLDVAIEVAHERDLKVTNGGITNKPLQLLVWQDYRNRGREAAADDFAARVFSAPADQWILRDLRKRPFLGLSRQPLLDTVVEDLRLPLVIWFDADGIPAYGLHDEPGALRANGETFKGWVRAHPDLVQ
jgi:hypothetical protein